MCRLLGVVSATPAVIPELLGAELERFAALSSVHCDGWGIAYWDDAGNLVVDKAPEPATGSAAFRTAVGDARTRAAILHLRKASVGMPNLPDNTHPFTTGRVAFAHNGYFSPLGPVDDLLGDPPARPCAGGTDSERYFRLVLAGMQDEDPVAALARAATRIATVARVVSLNALMLTEDALYALAYYDEDVIAAQDGDAGSYVLRFRPGRDAVVVASSGWEQPTPDWEVLGNGAILEVRREDLRTTVHRADVQAGPASGGPGSGPAGGSAR